MKILKITLSIVLFSILVACGGTSSKEETKEEKQLTSKEILQQEQNQDMTSSSESQVADTAAQEIKEVVIEGNDRMKFNLDEIKVKAGQTVRLTLKHVGEMTIEQMGHNWVLLKKGTDIMDFAQKSATAKDNGYVADSQVSKVITRTKLLGGGEQDTIEFEAPAKGTYDFICSFPGHAAVMQGKFIVE